MARTFGGGLHATNHRIGRRSLLGNRSTILLSRPGVPHLGVDGVPVTGPTLFTLARGEVLIALVVNLSTGTEDFEEGIRIHLVNWTDPKNNQLKSVEWAKIGGYWTNLSAFVSGQGLDCQLSSQSTRTLTSVTRRVIE